MSNLELLMQNARYALYIYFYEDSPTPEALFMALIYFMHSLVKKNRNLFAELSGADNLNSDFRSADAAAHKPLFILRTTSYQ